MLIITVQKVDNKYTNMVDDGFIVCIEVRVSALIDEMQ